MTRVATRRYRSVLRVFADLFEPDQAGSLDAELAWCAGLLGAVRDGEVLGKRLAQTLTTLPSQGDVAPVSTQLDMYLATEQDSARQLLLRQTRSRRYLARPPLAGRLFRDDTFPHVPARALPGLRLPVRRAPPGQ